MAEISRDEMMHIVKLASLNLNENEIETYRKNMEDILDFAQIIDSANVDGLDITIGSNEQSNVFRKDEVVEFEDKEALLQNAPTKERNMFKIPKVING